MTWAWAASLIFSVTPMQDTGLNWWWVAGDSQDDAALFVDSSTLRQDGGRAGIQAVRIGRDGRATSASWQGPCEDVTLNPVARFACTGDDEHMREAALLGGMTPAEAARAIFSVRTGERRGSPRA